MPVKFFLYIAAIIPILLSQIFPVQYQFMRICQKKCFCSCKTFYDNEVDTQCWCTCSVSDDCWPEFCSRKHLLVWLSQMWLMEDDYPRGFLESNCWLRKFLCQLFICIVWSVDYHCCSSCNLMYHEIFSACLIMDLN